MHCIGIGVYTIVYKGPSTRLLAEIWAPKVYTILLIGLFGLVSCQDAPDKRLAEGWKRQEEGSVGIPYEVS